MVTLRYNEDSEDVLGNLQCQLYRSLSLTESQRIDDVSISFHYRFKQLQNDTRSGSPIVKPLANHWENICTGNR